MRLSPGPPVTVALEAWVPGLVPSFTFTLPESQDPHLCVRIRAAGWAQPVPSEVPWWFGLALRAKGCQGRPGLPASREPPAPTQPFFSLCRDPNMGHSSVPTHWYPYTVENGNYLEINKKMDSNSMKQHLRTNYLHYWTQTYQALPTVTGQGAVPVPPTDDSEVAPVPPTDDSEAAPVPPTDDSEVAPMPPTDDSEAAPVPPTDDSEGAPVPVVIGF